MKQLYTLLFFIPLFLQSQFAQTCLPDGITFSTQVEINDFQSDYPGCSQILGDVIIENSNLDSITNLDSLSALTSIDGDLRISKKNLWIGADFTDFQ